MADKSSAYVPRIPDFAHQTKAKKKGARKYAFGFLMDQGTGKTKTLLDNAFELYDNRIIRALLIPAPNDVTIQWRDEGIPQNRPEHIHTRVAVWSAKSSRAKRECEELCKPLPGYFHILIVNHEALSNESGRKIILKFLKAFAGEVMTAVDEAHGFKTPNVLRTQFLCGQVHRGSKVRRILTGTPMDKPFDLYSQMAFLHPGILGFDSFFSFKHHFGVFATEHVRRYDPKTRRQVLHEYESLQAYQRLEELQKKIDPFVYIVKKTDCLDLPPKLYTTKHPEMSPAQWELYREMKSRGVALLRKAEKGQSVRIEDLGALSDEELADRLTVPEGLVQASIKMVLEMKLRQIAGGFIKDAKGNVRPIDPLGRCPRMRSVIDTVAEAPGKSIIWAVFVPELIALQNMLEEEKIPSVLVYGQTPRGQRQTNIERFKKNPEIKILVAHPRTLGTGMDFPMASTVAFYSIPQSSIMRIQSEDRVHRIGQKGTVNIYDFLSCPADANGLQAVRDKRDVSEALLSMDATRLEQYL